MNSHIITLQQNAAKRWIALSAFVAVAQLHLACCSAATIQNEDYTFEIVARTNAKGDKNPFTEFGDYPSIADDGTVAFIGTRKDGKQAVYFGKSDATLKEAPRNGDVGVISFNRAVQIGRLPAGDYRMVAQNTFNQFGTRIYKWKPEPFSPEIVATGGTATTDLNVSVFPQITMNNFGAVAYASASKPSGAIMLHFAGFSVPLSGLPFPMISDTGYVVARDGNNSSGQLRLFSGEFGLTRTLDLAGPRTAFTEIGQRPGISDDGMIVVFCGNRGNGLGIFASIESSQLDPTVAKDPAKRTIVKLIGENAAAAGPSAELGRDSAGIPRYFASLSLNDRVGVIRDSMDKDGAKGYNMVACFVGTPNADGFATNSAGTRPLFSAKKGLWTVRFSLKNGPNGVHEIEPQIPVPVVQAGSQISGGSLTSPVTVDDFTIYDPIATEWSASKDETKNGRHPPLGAHQVVFRATSGVEQFIVKALPQGIIRHIVVVTMENRSFDHLLGWLPGADGIKPSLTFLDPQGVPIHPWHLTTFQGCGCVMPEFTTNGIKDVFNPVTHEPDGWLKLNVADRFSIGYYEQNDLQFFGSAAMKWTVCDRYFAATLGETQPNRIILNAGQTDTYNTRVLSVSFSLLPLPSLSITPIITNFCSIWDSLQSNSLTGKYYNSHVFAGLPLHVTTLTFWKSSRPTTFAATKAHYAEFVESCKDGTLPAVSFVDPSFTSVYLGSHISQQQGDDDHPFSDIRHGEQFLINVYNTLTASPVWKSTALVITFDEHGGFFDHVKPPQVVIPESEKNIGGISQLGFRVPCLIVSPWSRGKCVFSGELNHASILTFIENNWGLPGLTVRDQKARDLREALDFASADYSTPPQMTWTPVEFSGGCLTFEIKTHVSGDLIFSFKGDYTCINDKYIQLQYFDSPSERWLDQGAKIPVTEASTPKRLGAANSDSALYRYRIVD